MFDAAFLLLLAVFATLTWGLIVLCDRVKGEVP
jgi:hypothetical protein